MNDQQPSFCRMLCGLALALCANAHASLGDCLKAAYQAANPKDLERVAQFASSHPTCLTNLVPPYVVPYTALSGSLDVANQSGALNQVGLGFGNSYPACVAKLDPAKTALSTLAPVVKPVCDTLNVDCQVFETQAASQVNAHVTEQFPLLGMMPCACAAATSGLGVEKIAETLKAAKQCGATLAEVGQAVGDAAKGIYNTSGKVVQGAEQATQQAEEALGKLISSATGALGTAYCTVAGVFGACESKPPPTGLTVATSWCKARAGLKTYQSVTNLPNDFALACNDGTQCIVRPNKPPRCQTPQMQAANQAARDKRDAQQMAQNKQWCDGRRDQLKAGYQALCRDKQCKSGVHFVAANFSARCLKNNDVAPGFSPFPAELWSINGEISDIQTFETLVRESVLRDPKSTPEELAKLGGCAHFLGRPTQLLCESRSGFDACKKLTQKGQIKECRLSGTQEKFTASAQGLRPSLTTVPLVNIRPHMEVNPASGATGGTAPSSRPPVR